MLILVINNLAQKKKFETLQKSLDNKIKIMDKLIKSSENKALILNKQLEAFIYYLYNFKNDSSIYQLLKPKSVVGKKKIRIGSKEDGGYILLDDFENIRITYSFGIDHEISFDKDLADKNIDIFMYDHSIEKLPFYNKKFHWKKIGLTEKKNYSNNMKTFKELLQENGHTNEKNMILKIDIDGGEWNIFSDIDNEILLQFKYIVVEFHFNDLCISQYQKVFKKLNKNHQIFHLHCNNYDSIIKFDGCYICKALEISYIIKENNSFIKFNDFFPVTNLDYKNCKKKMDINFFLNIYQFDNIISN